MPRPDYRDWTTADLLDYAYVYRGGLAVRALEAVLARGNAAVSELRERLRADMEDPSGALPWPAALLGELKAGEAAAELAELVRAVPREDTLLMMAAVEALAKLGAAGLGEFRTLARAEDWRLRMWARYGLGCMPEDEAHSELLALLDADPDLADVVATALADQHRPDAIEPLLRALATAEPWQRVDIEDAIRSLHAPRDLEAGGPSDWRLRYRYTDAMGAHLCWAAVVDLVYPDAELRAERTRHAPPLRTLTEILGDDGKSGVAGEVCDRCGEQQWPGTGVQVCSCTATTIAALQARFLGEIREEEGLDDLFDVLDHVEQNLDAMAAERPRTKRAREKLEDERSIEYMIRGACVWLIERGIEDVGGGRARLLAEVAFNADKYGDPDGVLSRKFVDADKAPEYSKPLAGRNDPCPCGSGQKYKKCCGAGARAPGPATSPPLPILVTSDEQPVSFGKAHYAVTDEAAVRKALEAANDLEADPLGHQFVWLERTEGQSRRLLGAITLSADRLVLECMSEDRLRRGRALIERAAGRWLTHRADTQQDPWRAVADASARGVPPLPPPTEAEVSMIQHVLAEHYRTWPDHPLPALDGRTPRDCARDPAGRRQLRELLDEMEEMEGHKPAEQRFDFSGLRSELGVEEDFL